MNDSSRESTPSLIRLFDACMAVDIWRVLNPSSRSFSWLRPNGAAASRIDLVGLPVSWVPFAGSCDLLPCPFSECFCFGGGRLCFSDILFLGFLAGEEV